MKITPIGNTLLVEAVAISTTIALPGSVEADNYKIVAIGDGDKVPKTLKVGDTIILQENFMAVPVKNTNFKLVNSDLVLAKVS